jgi:NADH-quinone oxidoreductase subunit N
MTWLTQSWLLAQAQQVAPGGFPPLKALSESWSTWLAYSLNYFLPELVLLGGFLLVVIVDLFIRRSGDHRITGVIAFLVLAAAVYFSASEYIWQSPKWEGGKLIFPYSLTLPAPTMVPEGVVAPYGMLVVDNLAVFFKMLVGTAGALVVLMSLASREVRVNNDRSGEYFALIVGSCFGMFLMPASMDLIMIYISLEMVSIAGYVMAGFNKDTIRSSEASLKYILYGAFSSGLMIFGFSYLYGLTGSTNIIAIQQLLNLQFANPAFTGNDIALWVALVLSLAGMGYKISAVPFHFWTPDVYEGAPTPVTAFLSVASKAAGFGLIMRFVLFTFPMNAETSQPIIAWPMVIAVLSAITMTVGNLTALQQTNLKRLLAYSSIAHAGYILMGLVAAGAEVGFLGQSSSKSDEGIVAILVYLVAYLFMNLGAFYVVMLIANRVGSEEMEDIRGLGRRAPMLATGLAVFVVSLIGLPLTVGFIGKLYLFSAIITQPEWLWLAIVAIVNTIVSVYYYMRVLIAMFMRERTTEVILGDHDEAELIMTPDGKLAYSWPVRLLLFVFLIPTIVLGVYFGPLLDFAQNAIRFFNVP